MSTSRLSRIRIGWNQDLGFAVSGPARMVAGYLTKARGRSAAKVLNSKFTRELQD